MGDIIHKFFGLFDPDDSFKPSAAQYEYVKQLLGEIHNYATENGIEEKIVFAVELDDPPANLEFPPGGLIHEIERQTTNGRNKGLRFAGPVPPSGVSFVRDR